MMLDEEKKEYEKIKYNNEHLYCDKKDVDCLLNLIEKQSKEIEEVEIKLKDYGADKINIFSGQTYMEKFRLLGALYVLQSLLEKE